MMTTARQLTLFLAAASALCASAFVVPSFSTKTLISTPTPTAFHVSSATSDEVVEASSSDAEESPKPAEEEKERHTLFIGNLPFETTDGELRDMFSAHGSVDMVTIPKNRDTGSPRGFAFVDMSTEAEVDAAVAALHETEIGGRKIRVQKSLPKDEAQKQQRKFAPKQDENAQKIYVGNLPYDVDLEDVKAIYAKFGEIKDAFLPMDRKMNRPRGFAFITLDKEVAEKAIEETNGMDFMGRGLTVSMPLPPGEKPVFEKREPRTKLYVGNLSFYTTAGTLREVFEEFGTVYDCYMPVDNETGGSRGFGFVTLDEDAAQAAITGVDGCELDGRELRVNEAQPKGASFNRQDDEGDDTDSILSD